MSYSNGKITAPISASDPYNCMGVGKTSTGYDVGYICSNNHNKINKWSLYKPIISNKVGTLTDTDYYNANFGYNIQSYNNYNDMKSNLNSSWTYLPPTGGTNSPYRLGDFKGYDHYSTAPFLMELNSTTYLNGNCSVEVPTEITWLTNWAEWSGYKGSNLQYLNCGFYVPNVGYFPLTSTRNGLDISSLDMSKLSFQLTSGKFTVNSTYTCYLVLTTWDGLNGARQWYTPSDSEGGTWWVLATDNPLSFKVEKQLTPIDYVTVTGSGTANMSEVNGYYQWYNPSLSISVKVGDGYNFAAGTLSIDVVIKQHYPGTGTSTQEKTILTFSINNVDAGFNQTYSKTASTFNLLTSKEDSYSATLEYTIRVDNVNYTKTGSLIIYAI